MEFGFTLKPDHSLERVISLTKLAEQAGFTHGWVFDSHVLWKEPYVLLTLMAQSSTKLRLGDCERARGAADPLEGPDGPRHRPR
jgi:alkanesulfonate monooxygenase SsuD/methylene tetrahydromethanopterin reductase-like flavin-dependent oxidoreductase (luciferase family)